MTSARNGKDGAAMPAGKTGVFPDFVSAGVEAAPVCDKNELEMSGAGCPALSPGTAKLFQDASNSDQLGMMLTQGLLAFQTNNTEKAGRLTKWVLEVVPYSQSDAVKGVQTAACEQRRQASAMQQYVAAGMASRGSSMVLTPRQSLQLLQVRIDWLLAAISVSNRPIRQ
jgi:hypothetical protein